MRADRESGEVRPHVLGERVDGLVAIVAIGGESEGLPDACVDAADAVLRIPTSGIVPSYNVQAATSIVLGEWMRQVSERG